MYNTHKKPTNMANIRRNIVLVTGCSKGIGAATVEELFKQDTAHESSNIFVLGVARSKDILQEQVARYGSDNFAYVAGDVTHSKTVQEIVNFLREKLASNTLFTFKSVIFNAGVLEPVACIDSPESNVQSWKALFDVNFFSIVNMTMALLPLLNSAEAGIKNVLFVSSGASVKPYKSWGAYGSSKSALNHFAATLAAEQTATSSNIRTLSVAPGVVDTEMQLHIRNTFKDQMPEDFHQRFVDLHVQQGLLAPRVPGSVMARLALHDIPKSQNGQYVRYNEVLPVVD